MPGSVARGDSGLGSDVDIIIIYDRIPKKFDEGLRLLYEMNKPTALIEPLGYTPREFKLMSKRRHPTALCALADGLPLHDDGFYEQMKREFERMVVDLRLSRVGTAGQLERSSIDCQDSQTSPADRLESDIPYQINSTR